MTSDKNETNNSDKIVLTEALLRQQLQNWEDAMGTADPQEVGRYRQYAEKIRDVIWTSDLYLNWTYMSPQVEDLLGYTAAEVMSMTSAQTLTAESQKIVQAEISRGLPLLFADRTIMQWPAIFDVEQVRKDGSTVWTEILVSIIRNDDGEPTGYLGITRDVSRRRAAEDELRQLHQNLEDRVRERTAELQETYEKLAAEVGQRKQVELEKRDSEDQLRTIMRYMTDAVSMVDRHGTYVFNTSSIERLTGWKPEELQGKNVFDLIVHPEDAATLQREMAIGYQTPGRTARVVYRVRHRNGQSRWMESTGWFVPAGESGELVGITSTRDITDRKRLEGELLRMQKLESVSQLSAGIAHDFNNLLSSVMGNLNLARQQVEGMEQVTETLRRAEDSCRFARRLTDQLLNFVQGSRPYRENTDLPEFLRDCVEFLLSGSNVTLSWQFGHDLPLVSIDCGQLQQVLASLVMNSVQAMPQGGTLQITVNQSTLDLASGIPLVPGQYLVISLKDSGEGINEENLSRIFDPYFSTRKKARGLGLSSAFNVMRAHGGYITVDSLPGQGATFHLYLPLELAAIPEVPEVKEALSIKGERIMVMEDDQDLLTLIMEMLEAIGFRADGAISGQELLEYYQKARDDNDPFSAVILDLTMRGGPGGLEVLAQLQNIDPDVQAALMSGYANDQAMRDFKKMGFKATLQKPFGIPQLDSALIQLLH